MRDQFSHEEFIANILKKLKLDQRTPSFTPCRGVCVCGETGYVRKISFDIWSVIHIFGVFKSTKYSLIVKLDLK